ncbi:hypothetical protein OCH239_10580 [Roseivivax halodurans JCM 10272]|uniref:ABC transporter domain-containing protein n=1 Tax=Roseivivax halodurans JCM 10272 TaxID=1449350 RepID=X7EBI2_9RHOB|nr:ABC transporter ATP-binding protein [Roseivivax halodurans]ETX13419.1 hypothetical protein OCH239_10580 [Roseivivax halodurans JCM 10272]
MTENLAARNLTLDYGRTTVVDALDLDIHPGRFTALLGPNGCGKSTILRALAGLLRPADGEVILDGRSIAQTGTKALARRVGILAQAATAPDGLTVEDLVRQGRYPHRSIFQPWQEDDRRAVENALARTALTDLRDRPIDRLSGGQRQRAWIAMTLAQESSIVLLDEPTTYLDLGHQVEVLSLMRQLVDRSGATIVAVLHDLVQAARHADRIVLLAGGRIMAQGEPKDVLTPDNLRAAFGVEIVVLTDPDTGAPICLPRSARPGDAPLQQECGASLDSTNI